MNKKLIALMCIFLIVSLPFAYADFEEAETDEEYGEDLIIEALEYQPTIVRSSLLEENNVEVRVKLGAARSTFIDIPKIKRVSVKVLKVRDAGRINTSLSGTSDEMFDLLSGTPRFVRNPKATVDDLGYVRVKLKKVEEESKVPDKIDIDLRAEIEYEAERTELVFGDIASFSLNEENEDLFMANRDEREFWNGQYYVRVSRIGDKYVNVVFYDSDLRRLRTVSAPVGGVSSAFRIDNEDFEYVRVKVEGVEDYRTKVKFDVNGKDSLAGYGENVVDGWKVDRYGKGYVTLVSDEKFEGDIVRIDFIVSETYEDYANVEKFLGIVNEKCGDNGGDIYKGTGNAPYYGEEKSFDDIKFSSDECDGVKQALEDLERRGVTEVKGLEVDRGRVAVVEVDGDLEHFREGDEVGDECDCKIVSIGSGSIKVSAGDTGKCSYNVGKSGSVKIGEVVPLKCGETVKLVDVPSQKEVKFTILPGKGVAKSVSDFSLHIGIDKRAINLSPDQIDEQIRKTRERIKKLDETIAKLEKIVDQWTKVCLATAAVFTVTSFLGGLGGSGDKAKAAEERETAYEPFSLNADAGLRYFDPKESGDDMWADFPEDSKIFRSSAGECYYTTSKVDSGKETNPIYLKGVDTLTDPDYKTMKQIPCERFKRGDNHFSFKAPDVEGGAYSFSRMDYQGDFETGSTYVNGEKIMVGSNGDVVVPIKSRNQLPSVGDCQNSFETAKKAYGDAIFLVWDKSTDVFYVKHAGYDKMLDVYETSSKKSDDISICNFDESDAKHIKKAINSVLRDQAENKARTKFFGESYDLGEEDIADMEDLQCIDALGETQCKILFNACDPVICPSSRCDFDNKYRVPNVVQSGLIGSTMLCLPNIKKGIVMPVCLSGILASLKSIRSVLQGYVSCLEAMKVQDRSVGICDKIRSVYVCEIIWKEALMLLKMKGGVLGWLFGQTDEVEGGYFAGGVDKAGDTLNYFTDTYAQNVFAAYKGRASEEIGTEICRSAIYGKTPFLGEIMESVADAQNPPQFTAYFEEHEYLTIGYNQRDVKSQYQVYYHIYAGNEAVSYKVYLKEAPARTTKKVDSGRIGANSYVDKSKDLMAERGFKQICVEIENVPYCGYGKVVSTSFAQQAVADWLQKGSATRQIESAEECRAHQPGHLSGYNPQSQMERVCSKWDPGIATGKPWVKVGTCGYDDKDVYLGDCWADYDDLKDDNPGAYVDALGDVCEQQDGYRCGAGEVCMGQELFVEGGGKNYRDVLCCSLPCEGDDSYGMVKEHVSNAVSDSSKVYGEMFGIVEEWCSDDNYRTNFFDYYTGDDGYFKWRANEKEVKELEEKRTNTAEERKRINEYYYNKGLAYLVCRDCGRAKEEFMVVSSGSYYNLACGEFGDKGVLNKVCSSETCLGEEDAKRKKLFATEFKVEKFVFDLTDYNGEEYDGYEAVGDKFVVGYPGIYKLKSIEFSKPITECSVSEISFKDGDVLKVLDGIKSSVGSTNVNICRVTDAGEINLMTLAKENGGEFGISVSAKSEFDDEDYSKAVKLPVLSPLHVGDKDVVPSEIGALLCYYPLDSLNKYSCLSEDGKKCSDYTENYPVYDGDAKLQFYFRDPNQCFDHCSSSKLNSGGCLLTQYKKFGTISII